MSAFTPAPYDPTRRGDYLRLLQTAWGPQAMSGDAFDWWFDGNPAGSLRSVALVDGDVVGVAGHSLCRLAVAGGETLGQFSVHAVTDERARGLGIFRALETRHEEEGSARGSAAVLAFASAPTRPLFLGPLGWTQIDRRRVWLRPLRAALGRLARRRLPDGLAASRSPGDAGRVAVRRLDRFGGETNAAYTALAPRLGNHVVRDARYLNWRYLDGPKDYRAFASPGGFAVVGHARRRGASLALVMELIAPRDELPALLRRCLAEARGGPDALLVVPSPLLARAVLARHGFVPTRVLLDFMGKGLTRPLDAEAGHWSVSLGDTDFF